MVERCAATQCWSVGPSSFRLGAAFLRRSGLIARARPILQDLVARTQETANLGILSDGGVLFVSQVESDQPIRVAFPPGTRAFRAERPRGSAGRIRPATRTARHHR